MIERSVSSLSMTGFHRIHYTEWGRADNDRTVICVHGLTRNGRDFDALATELADHYRVLCPDVVGRGHSDWLPDKTGYTYPQYCTDMTALIARTGAEQIDWVGTSMGGLIGMVLAAQPQSPIRRLVINDIGPFIGKAALERIASYVGQSDDFDSLDELERHLRIIAAPFGPLTDDQWHHLAVHSARQRDDGRWVYSYDPGIRQAFATDLNDIDMWPVWEAIQCPVLVLRGEQSDILARADAEAMTRRGPKAELVEFSGVGHAPALMDRQQIAVIRDWLLAD